MTHKITMKVNQPDTAGGDFAALADQLIQDSWHLPPDGDQSWREQDAQRIFSGHGKADINATDDAPSDEEEQSAPGADDLQQEPVFKTPWTLDILLPLSLATFVVFFAVAVSVPEILTAGFWNSPEPKATQEAAISPVSMVDAAPLVPAGSSVPEKLRPSLADVGQVMPAPVREEDSAITPKSNHRVVQASIKISAAKITEKPSRPVSGATSHVQPGTTKAPLVQTRVVRDSAPRAKRGRLPPIGEAYFASHTPAVPARKTATADWKVQAAKWDERANQIRAKREQHLKNGTVARAKDSSEFP